MISSIFPIYQHQEHSQKQLHQSESDIKKILLSRSRIASHPHAHSQLFNVARCGRGYILGCVFLLAISYPDADLYLCVFDLACHPYLFLQFLVLIHMYMYNVCVHVHVYILKLLGLYYKQAIIMKVVILVQTYLKSIYRDS